MSASLVSPHPRLVPPPSAKVYAMSDYEWIPLKQYAIEFDVSAKTVRRWIRIGKVTAVQHAKRGHWRVRVQKQAKAS